ncbi:ribosome recycling factor [Patescibacteria group bacterium]
MRYSKKNFQDKLEKTIDHLKAELVKLRTGRANPALLEDLVVDYYGTPTPLKQMASVSTPEPRTLLVQPWDKNSAGDITKALQSADLGLNPSNEGDKIRLTLPPLTEETRRDLVKQVQERGEDAKISVRNLREEVMSDLEEGDSVSEDEVEKGKKEIQEMVNETNQEIESLISGKEKEIMTV